MLKTWSGTKNFYPYDSQYYIFCSPYDFFFRDNGRNPLLRLFFPALLTPFPDIAFINEETSSCINEEIIGAINEAAIGATIALRDPPSCFFISCHTVLVAPWINRPDFSNDSTILTVSSVSSVPLFEMINVNPFPALTVLCPFVFNSNSFSFLIQMNLL